MGTHDTVGGGGWIIARKGGSSDGVGATNRRGKIIRVEGQKRRRRLIGNRTNDTDEWARPKYRRCKSREPNPRCIGRISSFENSRGSFLHECLGDGCFCLFVYVWTERLDLKKLWKVGNLRRLEVGGRLLFVIVSRTALSSFPRAEVSEVGNHELSVRLFRVTRMPSIAFPRPSHRASLPTSTRFPDVQPA